MASKEISCFSHKFPKMKVTLYDASDNPEQIIAFNYLKCIEDRDLEQPKEIDEHEAKKITQWVLEGGHTPALESISLGFDIRGISKVVSHQLVRHRIGVSIGQRTQRANSEEYLGRFYDNAHYIIPSSIKEKFALDSCFVGEFASYMSNAQKLYNMMLRRGISQDEARYIIPQASETAMCFNVSYKSLMHICSQRLCLLMQGEMVEIVKAMKQCVWEYNKFLGENLKPICFQTGHCNRNENNPIDGHPRGVCKFTMDGTVQARKSDDTFNLTKYSKSAD